LSCFSPSALCGVKGRVTREVEMAPAITVPHFLGDLLRTSNQARVSVWAADKGRFINKMPGRREEKLV
jgi:hypothetical protein